MAEYVRMPKEHYEAACNSIRAKTGKTDLITSGVMSAEIDGITGGGGGGSVEGYATVTFMNGADVLFSRLVLKGDDCPDPYVQNRIELPTKESTAQYTYTFNGWATANGGSADSNALKGITEDKVLYAAFAESVRKYTVTYYDEDGVTVLHTEQLAYGSMPSYVPTKEGASFGGWTPKTPVTGDTSYTVIWESVIASGTCGNTAYWKLDANYVLTIYGTGATNSSPWANTYKKQIQEVVIDEGITEIYVSSFGNHTAIQSVTFPSTLRKLGGNAFYGCTAIESVYIPDLASWLSCQADDAFPSKIPAHQYVDGEIPTGELVVPTSVTQIRDYAFKGWKITGVVFHDGVTDIGRYAFVTCKNITSLTIPASVKTIGSSAFHMCTALNSVTFADTEGWDASGTALASADLANPATAATYLVTTYKTRTWTNS